MGLGKIFTKKCAQSHVSSLWRLTWVFDGTWKNFHKKVCPVTRFFAVETILSFWVDLESFDKKVWPVTHFFFRSADYLKFLMGLGKFRQKSVTSYTFCSLSRLTWVFDGTWKNFRKKVCPVTGFFAVETNLSFWCDLKSLDKEVWPVTHFFRSAGCLQFLMGLRKISTKMCAQLHVFLLWRLSQVFDGTWKVSTKKCDQLHVLFAVETNLSFWWDLEKFSQKSVPSHTFLRCGD